MADPLFIQQAPLSEGSVLSPVVNQTIFIAPSKTERRLLYDTALIPIYASGISFILLVAYLITRIPFVKRLIARIKALSSDEIIGISRRDAQFTTIPPATFRDELREHITSHGGLIIFLHNALRFVICLALLGISIYAAIVAPGPQPRSSLDMDTMGTRPDAEAQRKKPKHGKHRKHKKGEAWFSYLEWLEIAQCAFYIYTSLLALLTITARRRLTRVVSRHLTTLLCVAWFVYAYRDLYPLATYTKHPVDAADGWRTWARVGLLTLVGAVLPLIVPRKFVPVNAKNPLPPNPEQTASILSFITWSFLDPVVLQASRVSHLPYESLPNLPDYDHADFLMSKAAPALDPSLKPKRDRHIVWGLLWLYRWQYLALLFLVTIKAVFALVSPVVLNKLLFYLETGGEGAVYKPWVWIIGLFLAPVLGTVGFQLYIFITTRLIVRTEAIITQLVFEHALKIRMKSETGNGNTPTESRAATAVGSRAASVHEPEHHSEESGQTAVGESGQASSSPKGKAPSVTPSEASRKKDDDSQKDKNLVGKITNLISTDLGNIVEARDFLFVIWYAPLQIGLSIWFLYRILGWAAFVGLAVMVATIPIPGYVATFLNTIQVEQMKMTDARVQAVTDTLGVIRMIKLFGWERKVEAQINEKREGELKFLRKKQMYGLLNNNVNHFLPVLTMVATFATYTLVMKQQLSASIIFSSIAVFDVIRERLFMTFWELPLVIGAKVSFERINGFLLETELLDRYSSSNHEASLGTLPPTADSEAIGFRNAVFSWSVTAPSTPGPSTPSRRNFRLRIEDDLFFKKGKLNLIIGPTGCGKTSMLMALLGEMHFQPEILDSFYNLPREGGVAYAAQEAWIQNASVKDNILFGSPYDESRYLRVLKQCALERDLSLFEAGDATEIGEKGVTLSGGQKARISLARAIYSPAEIIILDDVLSALDVHTSRWIVDKCLRGDLVKGRTVILVTHHVAMLAPIADFVVSISSDGRILSQGEASDALKKDATLAAEIEEDQEIVEKKEKVENLENTDKPKDTKPSGQLIAAEEIVEGRIGLPAFKFFFSMFGSAWFWTAFAAAMAGSEVVNIGQTWWLGYWAQQYQIHPEPSEVNERWYLEIYGALIVASIFIYNPGQILFILGSLRASKITHNRLVQSVLGTTLRWLDSTPQGRIVARFTQDMRSVDTSVPLLFSSMVEIQISLLIHFGAVVIYSPVFLLPGLAVAAIGAWLGQVYMRAQLAVKREMSNAKSPLYSHFGASIAGLTSIRAYGAEEKFKSETMKRINFYSRPGRTFYNLNRWISTRIDFLGGLFAAALGAYLVYAQRRNSSETGFSLTMALNFTGMLLWWVRMLNEFEVQGNSLERIKGYVEIEQEPLPTKEGTPPAAWPSSGSLRIEKLSAKYSNDGPNVLHDISFEIQSGEHVGVVGRTGAGKSSLSLSLLRMIPTTGSVFFDGVDTQKINLDSLRNNITIIPQQPELLSGTLRYNLDPFGEHDDAELNACLRSAGLFNLQSEDDEDQIGLDTEVSSGGTNFSLGQRQIIALARAMVRRSKVYLLDEATASVDYKTDTAIQEAIATEFNDMTLIIVAHRLQTIMNADKILVLDAGRVVEFDTPQALLAKDGSRFKALVDGSGDRDALYELARKKGQGTSSDRK
ncbi:hypothetical protein FRC05_009668 [Tulasnella sp. 425]|nr:hypothetical protein FRC05_009668 [Tulasnella sp. 425]